MSTATTWVLVGNASEAKLFESQNIGRELNLLKQFNHPASRNKGMNLVSDKVGSFRTNNGMGHGSFIATSRPKDIQVERFTRKLADVLERGRVNNKFDRLVVIMPPHSHGMLKKACNDQLRSMVVDHVDKDYTKLREDDLLRHLDDRVPRF